MMNDEQSGDASTNADTLINTSLPGASGSALGSEIQAKIGQHLRAMYDDVVRQGVPDRFMDLLSQLDGPQGGSAPTNKDEGRGDL